MFVGFQWCCSRQSLVNYSPSGHVFSQRAFKCAGMWEIPSRQLFSTADVPVVLPRDMWREGKRVQGRFQRNAGSPTIWLFHKIIFWLITSPLNPAALLETAKVYVPGWQFLCKAHTSTPLCAPPKLRSDCQLQGRGLSARKRIHNEYIRITIILLF